MPRYYVKIQKVVTGRRMFYMEASSKSEATEIAKASAMTAKFDDKEITYQILSVEDGREVEKEIGFTVPKKWDEDIVTK